MNTTLQSPYSQLGSMAGGAVAVQSPSGDENPCLAISFKCIECGRIKQEDNHWFVFWSSSTFKFYPFEPKSTIDRAERLACSESCLFARATKFIHGEGKK